MLAKLLCFKFISLSILQVAALFYFGLPGISNVVLKLVLRDDTYRDDFYCNVANLNGTRTEKALFEDLCNPLDCFYKVGEYKFCTVTQKVSIAGSIVFLMLQLLISRIIFPGMSNFLNASVGTPLLLARGSRLPCARRQSVQRLFLTRAAGSALRFQPKRRRIGRFGGMRR